MRRVFNVRRNIIHLATTALLANGMKVCTTRLVRSVNTDNATKARRNQTTNRISGRTMMNGAMALSRSLETSTHKGSYGHVATRQVMKAGARPDGIVINN